MNLDRKSLLIEIDARMKLGDIEVALSSDNLTLAVANLALQRDKDVATWLGEGAPGAPDPWLDPADHLVAGLDATLPDGSVLSIRPAPRRSTGPDLVALAFGAHGRFVTITRAWLRVHRRDIPRPTTEPFHAERNPTISPDEDALLAALERELAPNAIGVGVRKGI
ncbi:hypothetical protein LVJ94_24225 [Pendulispora rubella]|uniref:FAD-binding PCMH-type domain-containing protein n=1 Tax=Pendulispora rubella TaxID=2741070 RepID=A0ABZ2LHA6_9BACT